jgi:hypothetical protein
MGRSGHWTNQHDGKVFILGLLSFNFLSNFVIVKYFYWEDNSVVYSLQANSSVVDCIVKNDSVYIQMSYNNDEPDNEVLANVRLSAKFVTSVYR